MLLRPAGRLLTPLGENKHLLHQIPVVDLMDGLIFGVYFDGRAKWTC